MTQVVSLEAKFRATGTQEVLNGFKQIEQAAKRAIAQEKELTNAQKQSQKWQQNADRQRRQQVNESVAFQKRYAQAQQQQAQADKAYATGMLTKWSLIAAGVAVATKKTYEFAKSGAQIEYTAIKFDRLAKSAGSTGSIFLNSLRYATRGTVSDMKAMELGANLLQLGLSKNTKEASRLATVMTAMGMDVGEVTLALANQSTRRLDQLGISLTKFNEIKEQVRRENPGLSKEDLFTEAFLRTGEQTVATTGNIADSHYGTYQRFEASTENIKNEWKMGVAKVFTPVVEWVSNAISNRGRMQPETTIERMQKLRQQGGKYDVMEMGDVELQGVAQEQLRWEQYGNLWGTQIASTTATQEPNYDMIFAGAMNITAANEKYAEVMTEVNQKLAEARGEYARLKSEGYDATSEKMREQMAVIQELTTVQQEATTAQVESSHDFMQALLEQNEATAKQRTDYALASGQITQEAYNQQTALMAIADAFNEGRLSAEQAANMTEQVISALDGLDGKAITAYIDLVVGGAGYDILTNPGQGGGQNLAGNRPGNAPGAAIQMEASGGAFSGWALTGDSHAGPTPYSELVYAPGGAYVYNASQTRNMLANGMGDVPRYASGGAIMLDGVTNITPSNFVNFGGANFNKPSGSGGATVSTAAPVAAPVAAMAEVVVSQVAAQAMVLQSVQIAVKNLVTAQTASQRQTNEKLDTMIAVMRSENPRMIGQEVGGQFARRS